MLRRALLSLLALYGALLLFALFGADRILYMPHAARYVAGSEITLLSTEGGAKIAARHWPTRGARYVVLFSHGNAEDLDDIEPFVERLRALGLSVFAYDYEGYGLSEGSPSEKGLYADIDAAYAHLTGPLGYPPERIIAYGRSLGGSPSVDLARRAPLGGLVLESAFTSVYRVATRIPLFPGDRHVNIDKIGDARCPVLILHGRRDGIVPFHHGEALFARAPEPKRALWIDEAGHNDFVFVAGEAYDRALRGFVALLDEHVERSETAAASPEWGRQALAAVVR
ncbi:alpha/beta hydrolase [Chondromyces crocatus]|uniref:alpha/beta hydrolase n=1 Tax=Chondromyces crocatus TaxID=52 RepID=UPI001C54DE89|nr:alpha/beta hydrolase [Chondromyces crocatus]